MIEDTPSERKSHPQAGEEACERLLDAAEEIFARKGFAAASVRQITRAAGCNVAAVNYYFRGKEALYEEVFRRRIAVLREYRIRRVREALEDAGEGATLAHVVRAFSSAFLEPLMDQSAGRQMMLLMMQEMMNPHLPEGLLLEEMVQPIRKLLASSFRKLAPDLDEEDALACVHSLIGQLLHALHAKNLAPTGALGDLEAIQDHIVRFTVGGVEACRRHGAGSGGDHAMDR